MSSEYDVGYGKPPKETQFAKGCSGNPTGRPKGPRNIATIFNEVTRELIHVTQNGKAKTVTKLEAIVMQLTNKTVSDDFRATKQVFDLDRVFEQMPAGSDTVAPDRDSPTAIHSLRELSCVHSVK